MLALWLSVLLSTSPALGFDPPQRKQQVPLRPSTTSQGMVALRCTTYPSFTVLEVADPGLKGARQSIRRRAGTAAEPCETRPGDFALPESDGYFWGAAGNYLLIEGSDGFGDQIAFQVYAASGERLFSAVRNAGERFVLTREAGGALGLSYHHAVEVGCSLIDAGKDACWTKTLRAHQVPASLAIARPDCERAFREGNSPPGNRALVSLKVRVADAREPRLQFLAGAATCSPAP